MFRERGCQLDGDVLAVPGGSKAAPSPLSLSFAASPLRSMPTCASPQVTTLAPSDSNLTPPDL